MSANGLAQPKLFRDSISRQFGSIRPSLDRRQLIDRFIVPNAILEATLVSVRTSERNPRKMHSIKVNITGVRALAHSGKHLYQPFKRHSHLYEDGGYSERDPVKIAAFREFSEELQKSFVADTLFGAAGDSPLVGYIDESRHIYDVKMPHFSYQVDRLLDKSSAPKRLLAMVRDVESSRGSHGDKQPLISLTLLNSRLQGSKQINLSLQESNFALLGPLNGGNDPIQPLSTVQNRLCQLGLSPYATGRAPCKNESPAGQKFDYMKLREIQNIQWGQDAVASGDELQAQAEGMAREGAAAQAGLTYEQAQQSVQQLNMAAMEWYQKAVELDSLNKEAWLRKGLLLKSQQFQAFKESEECLKTALKLDPDDSTVEQALQDVMLTNRRAATFQ